MTESGTPAVERDDHNHEPAPGPAPTPEPESEPDPGREPDAGWWHRSHPTFAGLVGFFVGVAYVIVVPGGYAALLSVVLSDDTARRLFPLGLLALVVPLVLLVPRKTRRFAQFMLLGVISTAVVVGLTTVVVLLVMIRLDG
jgi:hypothetical protein